MAPLLAAPALAAAVLPFVITKYLGSNWNAYCLILPVAELLLFTIYKIHIHPNFLSPLRHLPQPKGALPFIGHDVALFQQPPAQDFGRWMRELENDGLVLLPDSYGAFNHTKDIANMTINLHRSVSAEYSVPNVC
jgi:hypothetical protein